MEVVKNKPKLLYVGDAGCSTGFANASHCYLEALKEDYDLTVLGLNYFGDPHTWPWPLYVAIAAGDAFGVNRIGQMCDLVRSTVQVGARRVPVARKDWSGPDVIVIQNDPWDIPPYDKALQNHDKGIYGDVPLVGVIAVDAENCMGHALNDLSLAVFWTRFALDEARKGGFEQPGCVVPLGVDLDVYHPTDKDVARRRLGLPPTRDKAFIVGNVNRNQPRKRWDLTIRYFAAWAHQGPLKDAYLMLHVAPTGDSGVDVVQLATYYGVQGRLAYYEPPMVYGVGLDRMRDTYNAFDVQVNTGQGEGFGLTTIEGMACGVPQVVGDWSGLGDWARGGASLIPCTSTAINTVVPFLNTIGGVPDEKLFVAEIERLYGDKEARAKAGLAGLELARQDRFRWKAIGEQVRLVVNSTVREHANQKEEATA